MSFLLCYNPIMNIDSKIKIITLMTLTLGIVPFSAFAQLPVSTSAPVTPTNTETPSSGDMLKLNNLNYNASINETDIDTIVTPEFPTAFQSVSIRLDSNTIDLNHYIIQWSVDEFEEKSGMGARDFSFFFGAYGSRKRIVATINGNGVTVKKNIILAPQDATVLWEAIDSYVPPFYRGKKLPGNESLIKISALPNFRVDNDSLKLDNAVYLWTRNDNRILNIGGYAKDSIIIEHNKLRAAEKITVDVSDVNNSTRAQKTVVIPIINPQIHWYYKNDNNYRKLSSIDRGLRVTSGNVLLVSEPYFFSTKDYASDLNYSWKVNKETLYLEPGSSKKELLVQNPGQPGQAIFNVAIDNPKTFLQSTASSISLFFRNN